MLFYPTAIGWHPAEKAEFGVAQHDAWRTIQRAHAIANGVYVAVVNRVGFETGNIRGKSAPGHGLEFWGGSFFCDPFGRVLAEASHDREEILMGEVDLKALEDIRRNWPFLRDRRIDSLRPHHQPPVGRKMKISERPAPSRNVIRSDAERGAKRVVPRSRRTPTLSTDQRSRIAHDPTPPKLPAAQGYRMPAEWEPHAATWLAWPHYHGDWPGKFEPIPWVYTEIIRNLARHERVELIVNNARSRTPGPQAAGASQRPLRQRPLPPLAHQPRLAPRLRLHLPVSSDRELPKLVKLRNRDREGHDSVVPMRSKETRGFSP